MTRSYQPISANILEFDDDFERTLRRARNQQEPKPSQPAPNLGGIVLGRGLGGIGITLETDLKT